MSIGVKFPFTIQSGSVALASSTQEAVGSQIVFCLGTLTGERVMRGDWGVDLYSTVLSVGGSMDTAMREGIEAAFRRWFPDYELREVQITRPGGDRPTLVEIEVRYGQYDSDIDEIVKVGTQVPGGSEIYDNEGF